MIDLVSIVIPIYNSEKYLKQCLDSVTGQTYKNLEIILINDGSTDNSLKICKEYKKRDKRIILIDKKNEGQGKARNDGIKKANGKYILFVDSDDWIDFQMVSKLYNSLKKNKAEMITCNLYKVENNVKSELSYYRNFSRKKSNDYLLSFQGPVCKLIKLSILKDNELYFLENKIFEDLAWTPFLGILCKKIEHLNEALYYYRIHKSSTMFSNHKNEDIYDIMLELEKRFLKYDEENAYKIELEFLSIVNLLYNSSLRFLKYKQYHFVEKNINIMKEKYPNWKKNDYYKKANIKFKIVINVIWFKLFFPLRIFILIRNRI